MVAAVAANVVATVAKQEVKEAEGGAAAVVHANELPDRRRWQPLKIVSNASAVVAVDAVV